MRLIAIGISLLLCGCDSMLSPEVADCERDIELQLRSPSTYKRIRSNVTTMDDLKPPQIWVSIEYDAANAYGTPIRDTKICMYKVGPGGRADLASSGEAEAEWNAQQDKVITEAANSADPVTRDAAQSVVDLNDAISAASQADGQAAEMPSEIPTHAGRFPYVAPDGVDITNAEDERNWKKYGTTTPGGGE